MSDSETSESPTTASAVDKNSPSFDIRQKMFHSQGNFSIDNLLKLEQKNLPKTDQNLSKKDQNLPTDQPSSMFNEQRQNVMSTNREMPNARQDGIPMTSMSQGKLKIFLKWQPCHFPVRAICFVYVNLPKVLLKFKY